MVELKQLVNEYYKNLIVNIFCYQYSSHAIYVTENTFKNSMFNVPPKSLLNVFLVSYVEDGKNCTLKTSIRVMYATNVAPSSSLYSDDDT